MDSIAAVAVDSQEPPTVDPVAELQPLTVPELIRTGLMAPISNPYPLYARARRETPVVEILPGTSFFVSRYDDMIAILKDHELSRAARTPSAASAS